jgi:hypothetical protein
MAVKPAASGGQQSVADAEQISEREFQATVNRAVEDTEQEIFAEALGDDELDNDGDTSLEDMGEGLEGEDTGEEGEEGAEGQEETLEAEGEEGEEQGEQPEEPQRDQRGRFREPAVPSGRLREQTERALAAEERAIALERQNAEIMGRLSELSARVNAPPQQRQQQAEPPPKPDMFAEPERYEAWLMAEAERKAEAKLEQRFQSYEQRQQAMSAQRVDQNLAEAARGDRGFEFGPAYNALTALDPRDPRARATVASIYNAPDPGKALFDWWDQNGGQEYRERIFEQLAPRVRNGNGRQRGDDRGQGGQGQPRQVFRPGTRLPSLNSATGSNSQRVNDPEMYDGSERSTFDFATRR